MSIEESKHHKFPASNESVFFLGNDVDVNFRGFAKEAVGG